ncbi:MAG: hypothetical protein NC241_01090 [Bacteroides sp.]|nr:hypothetical protein [Bacteroides sp.]MCM1457296.1 hypothetical protein [Lachnoclostridium sp.]
MLSVTGVLERRLAGAFDYANRDAERSTSFRFNTKNESNRFTVGYAIAPPTAIVLKRIRASSP